MEVYVEFSENGEKGIVVMGNSYYGGIMLWYLGFKRLMLNKDSNLNYKYISNS